MNGPGLSFPVEFDPTLPRRHSSGNIFARFFLVSTWAGIAALALLMLTILNDSIGYVIITTEVDPASLAVNGVPYEEQTNQQLTDILANHLSARRLRVLEKETPFADLNQAELVLLVEQEVLDPEAAATFSMVQSLFDRSMVNAELAEHPGATMQMRFWLQPGLLSNSGSSNALLAGIRTALYGSLWIIAITILVAFPIGVGAAIFLEEYTVDNAFYRLLRANITNLAGVPSIIYGMLGLAIFVRGMQPITSGALFNAVSGDPAAATGRTILSAGFTLALLILPLIIINAQEAIRAVNPLLRQASLGLGATQWETIWHHVLPQAMPGILTGTILAISRAIGETAPLVVVGAATYITFDPTGPFSKFTTLPIAIYQWVSRPQPEFRSLAAASILVLMALLLSLNAFAIALRNRLQKKQ